MGDRAFFAICADSAESSLLAYMKCSYIIKAWTKI